MSKGILRSLIGGLYDYSQQPSQEELLKMQVGMPQSMNPIQQSQMGGQYNAAQMGLPQTGFNGQMSPAAMGQQSPTMPVSQPGLMDLISNRYQDFQRQQLPQQLQRGNDNFSRLLNMLGAK